MTEVLYPFQQICGDFFDVEGRSYLVLVDRFLGWPVVAHMPKTLSSEAIKVVKEMFMTFGISEVFTSDRGTNVVLREMREFLAAWGVNQRIYSAYQSHANTRAEVGVKSMKETEIPNCHQRKWSLDDQSKTSFP